jgi:alcohol dehydrogenase class IV
LTHAVEAYLGRSNTHETRTSALEAVRLIHQHLGNAYAHPTNLDSRTGMMKASFLAGVAFTRAYVGYVHAIAHTIGGFYKVPHGLANAIIMPHVLEYYGASAHEKLAQLADHIGLAPGDTSPAAKALKFIDWIKHMNAAMNIPTGLDTIVLEDIPEMANRALHEANPLYPVPKVLFYEDLHNLYLKLKEAA